ncbi:arylsulfatase K-like [Osmerus eperlanus]|uniref:arylsulfatase K-like n=1 Tax=Osmerus eperlanus TaxID=29151 RepID=UPI002E0D51C8
MSALRDSGLQDGTVLMVTADHGDLVMEHRQFYKMSMLEGSSHVPLLLMGPGVRSGQQLSLPGSLVDLYPTLLGERGGHQLKHNKPSYLRKNSHSTSLPLLTTS